MHAHLWCLRFSVQHTRTALCNALQRWHQNCRLGSDEEQGSDNVLFMKGGGTRQERTKARNKTNGLDQTNTLQFVLTAEVSPQQAQTQQSEAEMCKRTALGSKRNQTPSLRVASQAPVSRPALVAVSSSVGHHLPHQHEQHHLFLIHFCAPRTVCGLTLLFVVDDVVVVAAVVVAAVVVVVAAAVAGGAVVGWPPR